MKTKLVILFFLIVTLSSFAQEYSATKEIKDAISESFNEWLLKGEFETSAEYMNRVKDSSNIVLGKISNSKMIYFRELAKERMVSKPKFLKYDADNEYYIIECSNSIDNIYIPIKRSVAVDFKRYNDNIIYMPIDIEIVNDKWIVKKAVIIFDYNFNINYPPVHFVKNGECFVSLGDGGGDNETYKINTDVSAIKNISEINMTSVEKNEMGKYASPVCYALWDIAKQPNYSEIKSKPINFTLEDLNITLPTIKTNDAPLADNKPKEPELDMTKVQTTNQNPNAIAVVIGNRDYTATKHVTYAIDDAQTMKSYLVKVLGYSESNIYYMENATKSNFETLFGTKDDPQGKLANSIKPGESDVFIYYSGHGAPSLKNNKGYFVPVDCDPQYVEQGGYSLDLFYQNISKIKARSVNIVTDACFSGAEIYKNISPITITVTNPIVVDSNCVVLSSSAGSQVSSWYNEKKHGLFTYFFLRAMQDREKSDTNKDGKLTYNEIYQYVSDKTAGVPAFARSIHNIEQTPTIQGGGVDKVCIVYK